MLDQYGRKIDYLRISVTDRCNLRCRYCMPEPMAAVRHDDILRYEEILRICRAAAELGITKFKVTGGEPLVRAGCAEFIAALKTQPGTQQVTLTTNGLLLEKNLDALTAAGLDGVNISLDTTDNARFRRDAGYTVVEEPAIPDDARVLKQQLIRLCDQRRLDLILVTGGAGSAAQEAMLAVSDKPIPGIASSAVRGKTLIAADPEEHMDALMDSAPQVMESLRNGR